MNLIDLENMVKINRPNEEIIHSFMFNYIDPTIQTIDLIGDRHEYSYYTKSKTYEYVGNGKGLGETLEEAINNKRLSYEEFLRQI